jgi:hypothetical protein
MFYPESRGRRSWRQNSTGRWTRQNNIHSGWTCPGERSGVFLAFFLGAAFFQTRPLSAARVVKPLCLIVGAMLRIVCKSALFFLRIVVTHFSFSPFRFSNGCGSYSADRTRRLFKLGYV